jgi:hypothetical protein
LTTLAGHVPAYSAGTRPSDAEIDFLREEAGSAAETEPGYSAAKFEQCIWIVY